MATTNLTSKSIGDILAQTGNGTPDHTAPKGSIYSDLDTGSVHTNLTGANIWTIMVGVVYGFGFYQDNTTQTTISTINTWFGVNNNFTAGDSNGVTTSTNTLVLGTGRSGVYEITLCGTIAFVTGTNSYQLGISINNTVPADGRIAGNTLNATFSRANVTVKAIVTLTAGDNIRIAARNITSGSNVIVRNAQLFLRKIG
jgi:hypothetical protein